MAAEKGIVIAVLCMLGMASVVASQEALLRAAIVSQSTKTFTLTENIVLTADLPRLPPRKTFTLIGRLGGTFRPVTIDGQGQYRMFQNIGNDISSNNGSEVVNLTLHNLVVTRAKWNAVELSFKSRLSISKVTFHRMPCALKLSASAQANVTSSRFIRNTNSAVIAEWSARASFKDCVFTSNATPDELGGGAISIYAAFVSVENSIFTSNFARTSSGGAISVQDEAAMGVGTIATIRNSLFRNNRARSTGGAVFVFQSRVNIVDTTFKNNSALTRGGGALSLFSVEGPGVFATVARSTFASNSAPKSFGGAFLLNYAADIVFCSCNFTRNTGVSQQLSNGYVLFTRNRITTTPKVAIPYVKLEAASKVEYLSGQTCWS